MTRGPATCWWSAAARPAWKRPGCSRAGATGSGSPSAASAPAGRCASRPARPAGNGWPCCADWLDAECRRLGVRIDTGTEIGAADLAAARAAGTTVLLATGSRPGVLRSRRRGPVAALDPLTVLAGGLACVPDGPVVVHDPVGGPAGVAMAEWLAAGGRTVTLVTPDQVAGTQLTRDRRPGRRQRPPAAGRGDPGAAVAAPTSSTGRPDRPGAAGRRVDRGAAGDRLRGGRGLRPPAGRDAAV